MTGFGYRPFIDPIDALIPAIHQWWFLLLPLFALFMAMAYRGVKAPGLRRYWRGVGKLTFQIIVGITALSLAGHLLVQVVVPALGAMS
ncbi:MAG: hypothetical protein AAGG07_07535 [Planctomycetota bacterium]